MMKALRLPAVMLAMAFALIPSAVAPAASHSVVRPRPFVEEHVTRGGLVDPPDTAFCQQNLGIACYRPAQIQKAYNLQPLFRGSQRRRRHDRHRRRVWL